MNYTLHQLRVFLEVSKNKSITKAAEELHLTQPAVSIQLKKLQEQFDLPLTEVIGRKLHVTEFGHKLARASERVLAEANSINDLSDQYKGLMVGKIRISIVSTAKYLLPYFLNSFLEKYPQVKLQVNVRNKAYVMDRLKQNDTDFAMVSVIPAGVDVKMVNLMDNHLFLVGSSKRPPLKKNLKAEDVAKLPLIFREPGSATRAAMESFLMPVGGAENKRMELVSNEAVKQAVNAGLGYSVMPLIGLRNELKNGDMKIFPVKGLPIVTKWFVIYNRNKGLLPASKAFIAHLEDYKDEVIKDSFAWCADYQV